MIHTLADLVRQAADRLRGQLAHEQNAALDAEVLARHVLGWDRARWLADAREPAPADFAPRFDALVSRRAAGEPVAYITGTREFWGLDFEVSPAVLVPRPETEVLVEEALKLIDASPDGMTRVADVGTGSGCIAVALAHSRPSITVVATDVSEAALAVAKRNAARHGVAGRVAFLLAPVLDGAGPVDLVVSNPPYIGRQDEDTVARDVLDFEPHGALFSGNDGLDVIRALLAAVRSRTPPPALLFEFGGGAAPIRAAVESSGLTLAALTPDLAGLPRVARVEA